MKNGELKRILEKVTSMVLASRSVMSARRNHGALRMGTALVILLSLAIQPALAAKKTGLDFLKIPTGARGAAAGQAYTALAQDVEALYWNPAGIAMTQNGYDTTGAQLGVSHQSIFSENALDRIGIVTPANPANTLVLGADITRLSYATQERRNEAGEITGSFASSDLSMGLAAARRFGAWSLGTQLKFLRQELAGFTASGYAVDMGLMAPTRLPRLSMGFAVRNLGPQMKFINEKFSLPLTMSIGSVYRVSGPLALSFDIQHRPNARQTAFAMGTEFAASGNVMLRAGYLSRLAQSVSNRPSTEANNSSPLGGLNGVTGGIGLKIGQFSLDYSIVPFGELGSVHNFALSTSFGRAPKPVVPATVKMDDVPEDNNEPHLYNDPSRLIMVVPLADQQTFWERLKP